LLEAIKEVAPEVNWTAISITPAAFTSPVPAEPLLIPGIPMHKALRELAKLERRRCKGLSFILIHQAAIHRVTEANDYVASLHSHGIVAGPAKAIASLKNSGHRSYFGTPEILAVKVTDLEGWIRYCSRDQRLQYAWVDRSSDKGPRLRQLAEPMHAPYLARIVDLYDDLAKPELCIGSGIGSRILRRAKEIAVSRGYVPFDGPRN
jgi:hypothetical protein